MKPIETQEDKKKREKRNKIIIGIVLSIILVFGTAGFAFFSKEEKNIKKVDEAGYEFELKEDGFWHIIKENYEFAFTYLPSETENISVPVIFNINTYYNKPLYFSSNNLGMNDEINRNLGRFTKRIQLACIPNTNCTDNLPIKNCSIDNIIVYEKQEFTKIKSQDNCVFIEAPYNEAIKAADAFLYKLIGLRS